MKKKYYVLCDCFFRKIQYNGSEVGRPHTIL